ncbi:hypothetical protein QBC47DRAFT_388975 [Echria macrotheca]|uniref:Fungal N-terminal domain-containing protein n=1 Tax=Echria macrotheca TaxID=438768 RepID=A0AAJ0B8X9_9PEZI|nr:hypothetical protein QBC47DRAFT_388975 [Echria macrotheca]
MDPLSITVGVLGLIAKCIKGIDLVSQCCTAVKRSELKLAVLKAKCSAIQFALRQIHDLYVSRVELQTCGPEPLEILKLCNIVFEELDDSLQPILLAEERGTPLRKVWDRLSDLWKRHDVEVLLTSLSSVGDTAHILLTGLQSQSVSELRETLKSPEMQHLIGQADADTRSLVETRKERSSIVALEEGGVDEILLSSRVYRQFETSNRSGSREADPASEQTATVLASEDAGSQSSLATFLGQTRNKASKRPPGGQFVFPWRNKSDKMEPRVPSQMLPREPVPLSLEEVRECCFERFLRSGEPTPAEIRRLRENVQRIYMLDARLTGMQALDKSYAKEADAGTGLEGVIRENVIWELTDLFRPERSTVSMPSLLRVCLQTELGLEKLDNIALARRV